MNKHLSASEMKAMEVKLPKVLSIKERWDHVINLFNEYNGRLSLLRDWEYSTPQGATCGFFVLMANDATCVANGLKGNKAADIKQFMEMSDNDIHSLFCYCNFEGHESTGANRVAEGMRYIARGRF